MTRPTRIIIRGIPSREAYIKYLQKHLPQAEWCFDTLGENEHLTGRQRATANFHKSLRMADGYDHINMEDDVILTRDFVEKAETVIRMWGNKIIQFFSMRTADLTFGSRLDSNYTMSQCTYYPAGVARKVLDFSLKWEGYKKTPGAYDYMITDYLRSIGQKYYLSVPSLVQHREGRSCIDRSRRSNRVSPTFRDTVF